MSKPELSILDVWPDLGKINALVKNIMVQMRIKDPVEAIRRVNANEWVVKELRKLPLLTPGATISVRGISRFVAADHVKEIAFGWVHPNFKQFFFSKTEENIPDSVITMYRLEKASKDVSIMTALGNYVEISLAHFFGLLMAQSTGETGHLLVNGYNNIAYIRGTDANIWSIYAVWSTDDGWHVGPHLVGESSFRDWSDGDQVISYKSNIL